MARRGQSIIEYLVVMAAIIAAVAALSTVGGCQVQSLLTTAINQVP